jgi:hypothetical protein
MSHDRKLVLPLDLNFWPYFGQYRRIRRKHGPPHLMFVPSKEQPPHTPDNAFDPWWVRSEFLLTQDGVGLDLKFFADAYGCFAAPGVLKCSEQDPDGEKDFEQWRSLVRKLLLTPRKDWRTLEKQYGEYKLRKVMGFSMRFGIEYDPNNQPYAVIGVSYTLDAILATIQIDLLDGLEFRECARPDCKAPPFKRTSGHERKYCSDRCAHLEAVRAHRIRQAAGSENPKAKAARQGKVGGAK